MITLIRAELVKLRTTRLWLVLLVSSVAVVGLIVFAVLASNPGRRIPRIGGCMT